MLKLKLLPEAVKDLEQIFEYTFETWGIAQAYKYQDELFAGFTNIKKNPEIGSAYIHTKRGYRKHKINRHLIFYRFDSDICYVIRILHERMDLQTKLRN
tara:strand:+ start:247 stop:543 length:297 start_codon:yes stop_codon:yes gene_type:complete